MRHKLFSMLLVAFVAVLPASIRADEPAPPFLTHVRQLTFDGKRSGEGYFSADGSKMIFQSEREADNPFYQIYLMNLQTGDTQRVSPGYGKTTCSWVHPDGQHVLYASTDADPDAKAKQKAELDDRAAGKQKRYAWDYDEHYDIYTQELATGQRVNLTNTLGYDAEGSYSPNGKLIAFASNRKAYSAPMSDEDKKHFEMDPAYMMDIYIMNADGSDVKQLTNVPGYDGGPFFSADGKKICWRRFSPDGATAEIFTMNIDGSDQQQLTHMGAMSWAPYFHPSGKYLIFTTNKHGFANFELYMVDAAGKHEPVRVTDSDGFDGLPVFSPDGAKLAWTSNRTAAKQSQIFIADWNHAAALAALGGETSVAPQQVVTTPEPAAPTDADITPADLRTHITYLASDALEGRLTGTKGEQLATQYVADNFKSFGLAPAGDGGSYFEPFDFTAGIDLGDHNTLTLRDQTYKLNEDWRPLSFTKPGKIDPTQIVFVGYGIVAPADNGNDGYDSYVHQDVSGKWVMMLRYMPEKIDEKERHTLSRYASLRYKAMIARDKGAAGIIIVSGPNSKVKHQLVPLGDDASLAGTSVAAITVTDDMANKWLAAAGKNLKELQDKLDTGDAMIGFDLADLKLSGNMDIRSIKRTGRNVIARLAAGDTPTKSAVIIGAHVDHLGHGEESGSLAHAGEQGEIHHGADDNASGVAAMLEIAQWLKHMKDTGKLKLEHDVIFAAWSGEELGLIGSSHYVQAHDDKDHALRDHVAAYLNMDMVGRYVDKLIVQGTGSSTHWGALIEKANVPVGLNIATSADSYLPTDSTSFYAHGVPILCAFTGAHEDYHRPTDTADKINYEAAAKIARFMGLLTRSLAITADVPEYVAQKRPESGARGGSLRAYLGTIPDYSQGDIKGVKLSGVAKGGPAEKAGVRGGDIIVNLAGRKIENIYDYTYAIEALKIGQEETMIVERDGKTVELKITPQSRD
ncbi:MAG: M28 family peptidase [Planctomycetes bacterium]|nr:M28 family peptidase [Planctomycetota bacterium]